MICSLPVLLLCVSLMVELLFMLAHPIGTFEDIFVPRQLNYSRTLDGLGRLTYRGLGLPTFQNDYLIIFLSMNVLIHEMIFFLFFFFLVQLSLPDVTLLLISNFNLILFWIHFVILNHLCCRSSYSCTHYELASHTYILKQIQTSLIDYLTIKTSHHKKINSEP